MSKILFLSGVLSLTLLFHQALAQEDGGFISDMQVYGRGGVDLANIVEQGEGAVGSSIGGPFAGFMVEALISRSAFRTDIGALAGMRGTNYSDPLVRQRMIYLDLPFRVKYRLSKVLDIYAGPQLSYLLDYSNDRIGENTSRSSVVVKDAGNIDLSASGGVDFLFNKNFRLGMGYYRSVIPFEENFYHSVVRVSLSVRISNDLFVKEQYKVEGERRPIEGKESIAAYHIKNMKVSALFVRLESRRNEIAFHLENGRDRLANKVRKEQRNENMHIVQAFHDSFDFCPVFFFYDYNSRKIRAGEFRGVLLNNDLEPDSSITPVYDDFYTADMGDIYFEVFETSFDGMAIMDRNFEQLEAPFPYYVRSFKSLERLGVQREYGKIILRMNRKLKTFYDQYY